MQKSISIFNHTYRWNMTKIFDTWNWNDHFRKFDWHEIISKWNWNIQLKRKINTKISMIDQIKKSTEKNSFIYQNNCSITKRNWSNQTRINYNEKNVENHRIFFNQINESIHEMHEIRTYYDLLQTIIL